MPPRASAWPRARSTSTALHGHGRSEGQTGRWCSSTRRSSPATATRSTRKAASRCPASLPTSPAPTRSGAGARPRRQAVRTEVDGLLAVCVQHEMDHLIGKLFVDYLSAAQARDGAQEVAKARRLRAEGAQANFARAGDLTAPCQTSAAWRRLRRHACVRAASLDAIAASRHCIAAIFTQPDRPSGRGRRAGRQPGQGARASARPADYQPVSLKDPDAAVQVAALAPDVMVVVAYGLLLPPAVLAAPRLGCLNVHASLLRAGEAPHRCALDPGRR